MKTRNLTVTERNPKEFDRLVSEYRSCGYFVETHRREGSFTVWARPPLRPRRRQKSHEERELLINE
jgi:hypothetical protein